MQIEIHEAVCKKSGTSEESCQLKGGGKGVAGVNSAKGIREKNSEEPRATKPANDSGFRESLEVIVVTVIHDFPVIKCLVGGIDDLKSSQASADPAVVGEDAPGVRAHGSALSNGDLQRLKSRESLQDLLNAEPIDH